MVTRYEGSFIDGYEIREFDEFVLPLGPAVRNSDGQKVPREQTVLEGLITRILYRGPDGRSSLEILRNYQSALEAAGFEILYSCGGDCGNNFAAILYGPMEMRIKNTGTSGGAFEYNISLLSKRANSVARFLTKNHNIDQDRMRAEGVGFLAPVATNDTPDGRAKNRRVELVKQ